MLYVYLFSSPLNVIQFFRAPRSPTTGNVDRINNFGSCTYNWPFDRVCSPVIICELWWLPCRGAAWMSLTGLGCVLVSYFNISKGKQYNVLIFLESWFHLELELVAQLQSFEISKLWYSIPFLLSDHSRWTVGLTSVSHDECALYSYSIHTNPRLSILHVIRD